MNFQDLKVNFVEICYGATKQNRTAGLRVTNPSLYQLSYSGKFKNNITQFIKNNNRFKNKSYNFKNKRLLFSSLNKFKNLFAQ